MAIVESRCRTDRETVETFVESLPAGTVVISGGAAGPERNQRIVNDADELTAFPSSDRGGGTEDTIRRAVKAGKPARLL